MKRTGHTRASGNKGFTLVELIVAMTISLIIIGVAGSILISSTNLFAHQVNKVEREAIADTTADFIRDRLLFAQSIEVTATLPGDATNKEILYIGGSDGNAAQKGYVYYKRAGDTSPVNAFGDSFYKRTTIALDYVVTVVEPTTELPDPPKTFEITVHIYVAGNDTAQYSVTRTYKLINSKPDTEPVASGSAQSTTTPFYLVISRG
jgi:prepilin-type N-terminal cleavage/methylation domain-containing protein